MEARDRVRVSFLWLFPEALQDKHFCWAHLFLLNSVSSLPNLLTDGLQASHNLNIHLAFLPSFFFFFNWSSGLELLRDLASLLPELLEWLTTDVLCLAV